MMWPRRPAAPDESPVRTGDLPPDGPAHGPGRMPRRRLWLLVALMTACLGTLAYRVLPDRGPVASPATPIIPDSPRDLAKVRANPTVPIPRGPFRFTEIARSAGIDFVHVSGATEAKHYPTAYGSGAAIFDADNDGKMDLYFANATYLPVGTARSGPNRLYRNLGHNRFRDVTESSGLGYAGFCHGIVAGDFDNDGDQDVFLCNYGPNVLYRNRGDGTFDDVSKPAGVDRPGWSAGGACLDFDNDGDLDLYVANYGSWKLPEDDTNCQGVPSVFAKDPPKVRVYCSPRLIRPARHFLYRNNGDGTFTDVAQPAGVGRTDGRGLGVVTADLNGDGRTDIYVANDICPNFVFLNKGDGTFEDATDTSGAGYDASGGVRAGMGVDAEDVDGDGRPDLFVTNFWNEPNSLFINRGGGLFEERTRTFGMMHDSLPWVGWGCTMADFDNDGWPDCFVTNGHVDDNLERLGYPSPYAQPALLHRNRKGTRFDLATRDAGAYFDSDHVGRGLAHGDIDDDGDIDLVINHKGGPPAVLRNDTATPHRWIRLHLEGTRSNRDGYGARIEIDTGERTIFRQRKGGGSLGSSHDPRLLVGLGEADHVRRITVRWPSGRVDRYADLAAGTDVLLREGAHEPETLSAGERRVGKPASSHIGSP